MDRTITLNHDDRLTAKDGTVLQMIRMLGDTYRMGEVLRWAARQGFTVRKSTHKESPKRACWLDGHGAYEGWSISCANRATSNRTPEGVDFFQDRHYTVFYQRFQLCNYYLAQTDTYEEHVHALIDQLLRGELVEDIKGRTRLEDPRRNSDIRSPTIVLKRAA